MDPFKTDLLWIAFLRGFARDRKSVQPLGHALARVLDVRLFFRPYRKEIVDVIRIGRYGIQESIFRRGIKSLGDFFAGFYVLWDSFLAVCAHVETSHRANHHIFAVRKRKMNRNIHFYLFCLSGHIFAYFLHMRLSEFVSGNFDFHPALIFPDEVAYAFFGEYERQFFAVRNAFAPFRIFHVFAYVQFHGIPPLYSRCDNYITDFVKISRYFYKILDFIFY
jgi:hypothetical protein